jgi:hypothetical protein
LSETPEANGRTHIFQSEATVLEGHLRLPLEQEIKPQAYVQLPEQGGYLAQRAEKYGLEAVISFRSAYTQVAGNRDVKEGHGWATLTTSVVEGLNVLDVLTADRVVGQIAIEHPLEGYVPHVSFLGTRFENLRIAGHPVELEMDLDVLGSKPDNDAAYTTDSGLLARVTSLYDRIRGHQDLPADLGERYNRLASTLGSPEEVECSLVNRAAGGFPGPCFGHVINVPNFGKIILARLTVKHEDFKAGTGVPEKTTLHLIMIELKLGCAIAGRVGVVEMSTNGRSRP